MFCLHQERITPGARYPIQSKEWGIRIDAAKRSKSTKPKGASANDVRMPPGGRKGGKGRTGGEVLIKEHAVFSRPLISHL